MKYKLTTKKQLFTVALSSVILLSIATTSHSRVLIDFQNGQGVQNVGAFDWAQTSFAADGGNQAIQNWIDTGGACDTASCDFTIYTHSFLTGVTAANGGVLNVSGLNSAFEITMIGGWTETVTNVIGLAGGLGSVAFFETKEDSGEFLQLFYDTNTNHNDTTGFGFNDGTSILKSESVKTSTGLFQITENAPVALDGFINDDYTGQTTISGLGTQTATKYVDLMQDSLYFKSKLEEVTFQNISIELPFGTVDPSDCFSTSLDSTQCANTHINGTYQAQGADANGGLVPTIGAVNGAAIGLGGGADFVAQTDYNSSFKDIPEPTAISLIGLGLMGLAGGLRRRSKKA